MSEEQPIDLPIAPKDIFRILALRSVVENSRMLEVLYNKRESIYHGIKTTERLDKPDPFVYEHKGLSTDKVEGKPLVEFTERQLCASTRAFFEKTYESSIGKVIDYELPLDCCRGSAYGKVDLVSLKDEKLFLLEVKKDDSDEDPLRAMFEIFTFWKMLAKEGEDGKPFFSDFLKKYNPSNRVKNETGCHTPQKVIPGLLLCKEPPKEPPSMIRGVFIKLQDIGTAGEWRCRLYWYFLTDPINLHVFSYSADKSSVTDVTNEIKNKVKNELERFRGRDVSTKRPQRRARRGRAPTLETDTLQVKPL